MLERMKNSWRLQRLPAWIKSGAAAAAARALHTAATQKMFARLTEPGAVRGRSLCVHHHDNHRLQVLVRRLLPQLEIGGGVASAVSSTDELKMAFLHLRLGSL